MPKSRWAWLYLFLTAWDVANTIRFVSKWDLGAVFAWDFACMVVFGVFTYKLWKHGR